MRCIRKSTIIPDLPANGKLCIVELESRPKCFEFTNSGAKTMSCPCFLLGKHERLALHFNATFISFVVKTTVCVLLLCFSFLASNVKGLWLHCTWISQVFWHAILFSYIWNKGKQMYRKKNTIYPHFPEVFQLQVWSPWHWGLHL